MTRRHPLLRLLPWWLAAALIVLAGWCALPVERTVTSEPTRLPITVLPTSTVYQFAVVTPSVTVTPREMILMPTRTPGPTVTRTPLPTPTPVPPTPDRPPVQRGATDSSVGRACEHSSASEACNLSSILLAREFSQVDHPLVRSNVSNPTVTAPVPGDTPMPGCLSGLRSLVVSILGVGDDSQVLPAVIERVAIDVVTLPSISRLKSENGSMHPHQTASAFAPLRSSSVDLRSGPMEIPAPTADPFSIFSVNSGPRFNSATASVQGYSCGRSIDRSHDHTGFRLRALLRAEVLGCTTCAAGNTVEGCPAFEAGKMFRHQAYLLVSDPGCYQHAGVTSCLYFTTTPSKQRG